MKYFLMTEFSAIVCAIAADYRPVIAAAALVCIIIFALCIARQGQKEIRQIWHDTNMNNNNKLRLHTAVTDTQNLALYKLSGADITLKTMVAELLFEAGNHLNPPTADSQVYLDIRQDSWCREGLAPVAQARTLIEEYSAAYQETQRHY